MHNACHLFHIAFAEYTLSGIVENNIDSELIFILFENLSENALGKQIHRKFIAGG
jgi:hypothetical protein